MKTLILEGIEFRFIPYGKPLANGTQQYLMTTMDDQIEDVIRATPPTAQHPRVTFQGLHVDKLANDTLMGIIVHFFQNDMPCKWTTPPSKSIFQSAARAHLKPDPIDKILRDILGI